MGSVIAYGINLDNKKMEWLHVCCLVLVFQLCRAPPVTNQKENGQDSDVNGLEDYMEYHRYLKEVVNALESDVEFASKLEKANESDIKSGKIAEELEFVSHHVRTRLDEIKRVELERLRHLVEQRQKLEDPNSIDTDDPTHHHLDHSNPHTFEVEDLKKLIAKATADLAEVDKQRKEDFKKYELEKEYKKQEKLNHTNGEEERKKLEMEYQEMEKKHKNHEKLHEPGHKAQLEEVWEEQDQMQQDFDPKTFFMLHDLDGNGLWDQDEVKALFVKELDKMYQQGNPEDDWRERVEEMERMRESVFKEMDTNHDGFIDFNEFVRQTNTNEYKQDHGWQGLDEQRPFTDEEYAEYIRQYHASMNNVPPGAYQHPGAYQQGGYQQHPQAGYQQQPPPGYQQQPPPGYQQHPQAGYQQHPQAGYQQPPQGGYQQPPPAGYQQPPPGGYQQGHQGNYQQVPQGGYQQQVPQNYQQQAPQGGIKQQVPQNSPQVSQGQQQAPPQPPQPAASQQNQQAQSGQQVPPQQAVPQQNQQPQGEIHQNDLNTNEVHPAQHQQKAIPNQPQSINEVNSNDQQHVNPKV